MGLYFSHRKSRVLFLHLYFYEEVYKKMSKGEEKIIKLLQDSNIRFIREKKFVDMKKHGNHLRFDFYIPETDSAIEIQGEQHYRQIKKFHKTRSEFIKAQEYDRYKITYCLSHGIKLYCIPYWELDDLLSAPALFERRFRAFTRWKNDVDWQRYQNLTKHQ